MCFSDTIANCLYNGSYHLGLDLYLYPEQLLVVTLLGVMRIGRCWKLSPIWEYLWVRRDKLKLVNVIRPSSVKEKWNSSSSFLWIMLLSASPSWLLFKSTWPRLYTNYNNSKVVNLPCSIPDFEMETDFLLHFSPAKAL